MDKDDNAKATQSQEMTVHQPMNPHKWHEHKPDVNQSRVNTQGVLHESQLREQGKRWSTHPVLSLSII